MRTEENPPGQNLLSFYGESLAAYSGEGTLTLEDTRTASCSFEAGQLKNGSVFLLCNFPERDPFLPHRDTARIRSWESHLRC